MLQRHHQLGGSVARTKEEPLGEAANTFLYIGCYAARRSPAVIPGTDCLILFTNLFKAKVYVRLRWGLRSNM